MDENGMSWALWTMFSFIAGIIFERNFPKKGSPLFGHMMTGVFVLFIFIMLFQSGILTAIWNAFMGTQGG